jgi:hypothetical protein
VRGRELEILTREVEVHWQLVARLKLDHERHDVANTPRSEGCQPVRALCSRLKLSRPAKREPRGTERSTASARASSRPRDEALSLGIGLAQGRPCSITSKRGRGMTRKVSPTDDTRGGFASLAGCARSCCSHRYKAVFSGAVARMGGEPTAEITVRARTRLTSWRAKGARATSMTPSARARATRRFASLTLSPITFAKRPASGHHDADRSAEQEKFRRTHGRPDLDKTAACLAAPA